MRFAGFYAAMLLTGGAAAEQAPINPDALARSLASKSRSLWISAPDRKVRGAEGSLGGEEGRGQGAGGKGIKQKRPATFSPGARSRHARRR